MVRKKSFKGLIVIMSVCLIGIVGFIGYFVFQGNPGSSTLPGGQFNQPPGKSVVPMNQTELVDSDGDGMSDWFESNIAGYNPNVPNDRYVIYCQYLPELDKEYDIIFNLFWHIWVEENKVPPKNIISLRKEKATYSNFKKAIEEIAVTVDENDIIFISLSGHANKSAIACCNDSTISYSEIDKWLDEIRAKVVIAEISGCQSEGAAEIMKDGPCPRIVLTGGFSMEGFYNKETADKYPWLPTYKDYGYNNPDPALDYYDIFFSFADRIGGNGDGYVSLGEFIKVLKEDVEARWDEEEWRSITDYPWWDVARDEYGIADRVYLIEHSPKENIFWKTFHP